MHVCIQRFSGGQRELSPASVSGDWLLERFSENALVLARIQPLKNSLHRTFSRIEANGKVYDLTKVIDLTEVQEIYSAGRQLLATIQPA